MKRQVDKCEESRNKPSGANGRLDLGGAVGAFLAFPATTKNNDRTVSDIIATTEFCTNVRLIADGKQNEEIAGH